MRRVAISAPSGPAAEAGAAVADAGGNAVDAAIAATVSAMIAEPGIIGPGAGAFVSVWPAEGEPRVIDGYAAMPGLGGKGLPGSFGERIHMDYGGGMDTLVGPCSVAVPGVWASLGEASKGFGALDWAQVLAPSVELAARGFRMSGVSEAYLAYSHEPIYDREADSFAALHHVDGSRVAEGDVIRIEGLEASLRAIADEGPDSFYTGSIAARLAAAMEDWGGSVTAIDLQEYAAITRDPVRFEIDGWTVVTNPAPAIGGAVLAAMLMLIGERHPTRWDREFAVDLVAIQRAVLAYRAEELDRASPHTRKAVGELLRRARLGDHRRLTESASTVHVSTVDTEGLACAVTTSAGYGSGVMIPGTGLWLNNSLGEVELFPHGMQGFAPGDRLPSNMAPTIARGPNGEVLAIGGPGASRITTSIAQVLTNFALMGMSVREAVAHPRLHVEVFEGRPTIAFEPGIEIEPFEDFHVRRFPDISMYFGGVGVAMVDPVAGLFEAADPRRTGVTAVGGL